jgi:hypothetical protein
MHQPCINLDSSRCTNIINYTPHVCANSSTTCLNHVPNMYLNHIPKTYTNITIKSYLTIHHFIYKPNTINPYIKPCATTSLLCSLKLNQQLQQHITTKIPIPICQIPTVSLYKYDICNNTEHPIPSQEIKPSLQNIPQTRCAISLINRPQPCFCRDFSTVIFLPHFFCRDFSVALFSRDFSATVFLPHFFCFTFPATLFLLQFFSINNICPNNLSKNRYSMIFKCD